jgi:DNA-binding NarL/FixJ family response regulator
MDFDTAEARATTGNQSALRLVHSAPATVDGLPSSLWAGLMGGHLELRHELSPEVPWIVWFRERARPGPDIPERESQILERVLSGDQQKTIALDLGVSEATVSGRLARGLGNLGLVRRTVPLVVAVVACARSIGVSLPPSRCEVFSAGDSRFRRVALPAPTLAAARALTGAQRAVACMLLEGRSRAEMAAQRATSVSTIAVQLTSLYTTMGASGRFALLRRVLSENLW